MPDLINQAEREAVAQLEGFMADAMGELKDECEAEFEAAMDLDGEPVPGVSAEKAKGVTGASFRALRALLEKQVPQYGQSAASATMSSAPAPPQGVPGGVRAAQDTRARDPATALGARASRLQSRRSYRLLTI